MACILKILVNSMGKIFKQKFLAKLSARRKPQASTYISCKDPGQMAAFLGTSFTDLNLTVDLNTTISSLQATDKPTAAAPSIIDPALLAAMDSALQEATSCKQEDQCLEEPDLLCLRSDNLEACSSQQVPDLTSPPSPPSLDSPIHEGAEGLLNPHLSSTLLDLKPLQDEVRPPQLAPSTARSLSKQHQQSVKRSIRKMRRQLQSPQGRAHLTTLALV